MIENARYNDTAKTSVTVILPDGREMTTPATMENAQYRRLVREQTAIAPHVAPPPFDQKAAVTARLDSDLVLAAMVARMARVEGRMPGDIKAEIAAEASAV